MDEAASVDSFIHGVSVFKSATEAGDEWQGGVAAADLAVSPDLSQPDQEAQAASTEAERCKCTWTCGDSVRKARGMGFLLISAWRKCTVQPAEPLSCQGQGFPRVS